MESKTVHYFVRLCVIIILLFMLLVVLFACSVTKIITHNGEYIVTDVNRNICYTSKIKLRYTEEHFYNGVKDFYFSSKLDTIYCSRIPWNGIYSGYFPGSNYSKPFQFEIEFPTDEKQDIISIITPYKHLIISIVCHKKRE